MAELGDALTGDIDGLSDGVTVDMLDYEFVSSCNDIKQLKAILNVLHSGKEGIYPHVR